VGTYARLEDGQELTYRHWIEAVRAGRTFATRGPLVTLTVNGQHPGGTVRVTEPTADLHVRATARSLTPFARLVITTPDRMVAEAAPTGMPFTATIETNFRANGPTYVVGVCDEDVEPLTKCALMECARTTPVRIDF